MKLPKLMIILSLFLCFSLQAAAPTLKKQDIDERLKQAIDQSLSYKVVLDDLLGEGPGAWHSAPRYPTDTVNCIIWLQMLMAEVYGKGLPDKTPVLDRIRYYNGQVGFSLRKHYTDHWLALDPEPLRKVSLAKCAFPYYAHAQITPNAFLKNKGFSCPLYEMDHTDYDIEYAHSDGVLKCAGSLPLGYYVLFAIPSDAYSKKYLSESGPMGLVHAMILKTSLPMKIYHASTSEKKVMTEDPVVFFERMKNLHLGYAVYDLIPDWDYTKNNKPDLRMKRLLSCEAGLPRK